MVFAPQNSESYDGMQRMGYGRYPLSMFITTFEMFIGNLIDRTDST